MYIPFTTQFRYSDASVQSGVRINSEMKIWNENGLLLFLFAYVFTVVMCLAIHLVGLSLMVQSVCLFMEVNMSPLECT